MPRFKRAAASDSFAASAVLNSTSASFSFLSPGFSDNARRLIEDPRRAREAFAPEFSFTSREGEFISLDELKGRTVLLDFWGSWCGPCVQATPGLIKLRRKFTGQPVIFVGIARDEQAKWSTYLEKNNMDWPQYLDTESRVIRLFRVEAYPTYIVLDGDGIIRARKSGYGSDSERWLESEIKKTEESLKRPAILTVDAPVPPPRCPAKLP